MVQEISTPVVLAHSNIVPGSEVVSVKGSTIPAFIRNSDYIIDYTLGQINFLADGAAVALSSLIDQNGLDVTYSYKIDFTAPELFESQVEVFSEVGVRVADYQVSVINNPVSDVSRILNLTTQEEYTPESISENIITFSANFPPNLQDIIKAPAILASITFDTTAARHVNIYSLTYPSNLTPALNPIVDISSTQSLIYYPYLLLIGGEEVLNTTIQAFTSLEATNIQLVTGGRTLRSSTTTLLQGTDYTFSFTNALSITDFQQVTIKLTATAVQKIRTNNLYMYLSYTEVLSQLPKGQIQTITHHVNEIVSFTTNTQKLTKLLRQVNIGSIGDVLVLPTIQVVDPNTGAIFTQGSDYTISETQNTITKLATGKISQEALIYYIEQKTLTSSFTVVADVILVDYIWTKNALNWSSVSKQVLTTQKAYLTLGTQSVTLTNVPSDSTKVLIYLEEDYTKTSLSTPVSYNNSARRLMITPIPATGTYILEYEATSQPIPEGSPYFVNYKYGATRNVLANRFAPLVGLTNTHTERQDIFALSAGATTTQLTRSPTSLDSILIFKEGDAQKSPVASAVSYDSVTSILTFTSLGFSGSIVFQYLTNGFDTASLRTATVQLFNSFATGPTLQGFQDIIAGFVSTTPIITSGLANRYVMPNANHTTGNAIARSQFQESPPLSDGSPSVTYLPSSFDLGALFETSKGSYVTMPTVSNIDLPEGTLEFLTGVVFDPNDQREHFFVDIQGTNPQRNRFCIYKSKNNKLNFDIWDDKGQLFRTSADVNQIYNTEIINLKAGATTAVLSFNATPASLDINSNGTPDLYDALETAFIIMPETPTFPPAFLKKSIKVISYDAPTRTVTFEPVDFSGNYVFSYVGGLTKFEDTANFIAVTWKLHTHDGQPPFYRLYTNGIKVVNQTLENLNFTVATTTEGLYDSAQYDIDVFEE